MKSWFIFLINGKKVGTWANNEKEAKKNIIAVYGNIPMSFIGINFGNIGPQYDEVIHYGMSSVDSIIASGILNRVTRF